MTDRISGILTPNITPVDSAGRVDEETLRGYVDWLIDHGVDGLYPNGSTGEFVRFTANERRRIVEVVVDQTAGRVPVLAGAAEANADETIRACNAYGQMGVRAVAIVAPFYYRLSSEGVYAYFQHIARHVDVDVTLYNIPMFASPIDVDTVVRLAAEEPRVVGLKDSSGDLPNLMRMMSAIRPMRDDFSFLTGWDPSLSAMLIAGADGGTNATSGVLPELTRAIYQSVRSGDIDRAIALQYELIPLFDMMIGLGEFPEGFRAGARARGWDLGNGRVPITAKQRHQANEGAAKIAQAVSVGLGNVGATKVEAASSVDAIEQIVRRVLSQLE
ncbi:dihydrodipicolinate synthase family protein [Neorhodopirellula pilleata]|uniref:4-hydroxy-tetrahydrodipicolinate synthase n=1 Tax=Neorhodopirellula pilleata TaxID=2714738 RepID=A0A5C6AAR7_9BACT|nr:dihydrodipicolinate synthase family protein [Neorhodopirellula pilleata]TWT96500.1 4-hydroxy-tetrahydrodipicolinate synthase [Neorhodopirellula pilleata]